MKSLFHLVALIMLCATFGFAQGAGGVKGRVRSSRGDGVAGATITARRDGRDVKTATSNAKGIFLLDGLEPGIYTFIIEKNGYTSGTTSKFDISNGTVRNLGDNLILGVDQGTQVIIKGSVFNQDGQSIPGATVKVEKVGPDGKMQKLGSGLTSEAGEFTYHAADANRSKFRITASAKGVTAAKDVEVDGAAIYRLAITLNITK
jgi:Carboxypeptidase regulatory-like domain